MSNLPSVDRTQVPQLRWRYTICALTVNSAIIGTAWHFFQPSGFFSIFFFAILFMVLYAAAFIVLPSRFPRLSVPPKPAR